MNRRELMHLLGGAALVWPGVARAQQKPMPVIGYLSPKSANLDPEDAAAFREGLAATALIEGRDFVIEYRWAAGDYGKLPALAADLAARKVRVIFALSVAATVAAKAASSTIPIVFTVGPDPVGLGLVASLNHPAGNLTGAAVLLGELWPKRLELLHELVPTASAVGVLVNPDNPNAAPNTAGLQLAATAAGFRIVVLRASIAHDFETAFATIRDQPLDALLVGDDPFFESHGDVLARLASRDRVPAIYAYRKNVVVGGLASYGPSLAEAYRLTGQYAGRILKGEKAADLPVQQPTKFELVINLKTSQALGLPVPQSILQRADEVIE
jgi:putative ABC transport system substrate-binding protein